MRSPGRAPSTRPAIVAVRTGPAAAAGGISVNVMRGAAVPHATSGTTAASTSRRRRPMTVGAGDRTCAQASALKGQGRLLGGRRSCSDRGEQLLAFRLRNLPHVDVAEADF